MDAYLRTTINTNDYEQTNKIIKTMSELSNLSVDELNELHKHLKSAANILNRDRLTLYELYANDCKTALDLECTAMYVMDELFKRARNKTKE